MADVGEFVEDVKKLVFEINDFLEKYKGTKEDKSKAVELHKEQDKQSAELIANDNLSTEDKVKITEAQTNAQKSWEALEKGISCAENTEEKNKKSGPREYYIAENDFDCHKIAIEEQAKVNGEVSDKLTLSILEEIPKYKTINHEFDDLDADTYFDGGKLDTWGGGDRIVVKDKINRVLETYTSPNYDLATWQKIKKRFWIWASEKSNASWEWDETYQTYTLGNEKKNNNWYGAVGTLTMTIKDKKVYLSFDNFKLNMLGSIYIGPFNPKKTDNSGKEKDDYSREPQDLTDAVARAHDLGYDEVGAENINGAFVSTITIEADIQLVRCARKIIDMYSKNEIDTFTKNPISKETFERAKKTDQLFTLIVRKKVIGVVSVLTVEQQKILDKMNNYIILTIDNIISPVNGKGEKIELKIK